jgi:hypothetical protein
MVDLKAAREKKTARRKTEDRLDHRCKHDGKDQDVRVRVHP